MSCAGCSWLRPGGHATVTLSSSSPYLPNLRSFPYFLFPFSKAKTTGAPPSVPSNSPSLSLSLARAYSRRWYNPIRRRGSSDDQLEFVRDWIDSDAPPASEERFTVVSYNILGDKNASKHGDLYPNVPLSCMKWSYRKRVIFDELISRKPDIICMQEVDKYLDLFVALEKVGYSGSFKRRTGGHVDGCAMFWKRDKFRLLERENIEFEGFDLRDNVAQLSVFEMCKAKSRKLLVGNIHVLYNPSRGDVKLGQIRLLSSRARTISNNWGDIPIVLAGDFNITPKSALYNFLASSKINLTLHDRKELSGQGNCHPPRVSGGNRETMNSGILNNFWTKEEIKVATGHANSYRALHPLKLSSSYATVVVLLMSPFSFQGTSMALPIVPCSFESPKGVSVDAGRWTLDSETNICWMLNTQKNILWMLDAPGVGLDPDAGRSACPNEQGSSTTRDTIGEPLATSYHSKFLGTVDYLWYSDGIVPTGVLDTFPINVLKQTGGLPCQKLGSDHLALVSEFAFTNVDVESNGI